MFDILMAAPRLVASTAALCTNDQTFFGLPAWYKYLKLELYTNAGTHTQVCRVVFPQDNPLSGIFLIGLAVVDMLLTLAGIVTVGFIIYGGFLYLTSQGEPDRTKKAKDTILGALIGLVIVLIANPIVSFIGNKIGRGL